MVKSKNICDANYFEIYFKKHIQAWRASANDVNDFISIDYHDAIKIESFIDGNKKIKGAAGISKNVSFLSILADNIPGNDDNKENLIIKLIVYADRFYEEENDILFDRGLRTFLPIKELVNALNIVERRSLVLRRVYNESQSFHMLTKLLNYYKRDDIKTLDADTIKELQSILLNRLQMLDAKSISTIKFVSEVLYRWNDWSTIHDFHQQREYLININLINDDECFAKFLINMAEPGYSNGRIYYIPYYALIDFFGGMQSDIEHRIKILLESKSIDELSRNELNKIDFRVMDKLQITS